MLYRVTWMDGDCNAACLGLDETVEAGSAAEAVRDATYHAECQGVDLDRFHAVAEPESLDRVFADLCRPDEVS